MFGTELQSLNELKNILKINKNDEKSIQLIAQNTAKNILQNIIQVTEKIQDAKKLAEDATNIKSDGWFSRKFGNGKTAEEKATRLNTKAISQQNEAMTEMNALIKESIKLTCCSIFFAKEMTRTLAVMMADGFEDSNGRHIQLSGEAREQVEFITQQAEDFIEHQAEYEERQEKQEREIGQNKENISQNRQNISQNRENILINQQTINQNRESIAKNAEAIEHLKSKNSSQSLVISIIALAISIVSLALHFIN